MSEPDTGTSDHIGRFAPSPTGPVHFGTLIAAVGSYLQARANRGRWLIRMEDVDTTRRVAGADRDILDTLEAFGMHWDGEVVYQSRRTALYQQAFDQLDEDGLIFPCLCSRKQLADAGDGTPPHVYPGTCRQRCFPEHDEHAVRVRVDERVISFTDQVFGQQNNRLDEECGDFVIRRRDGLFAYQLAVVVDDALQGITEVVRGADLLNSTARQIYLQQLLGYSTPDYCHLPLAVDDDGNKISKSAGAARVDAARPGPALVQVLRYLGQNPPSALSESSLDTIWQWAIQHWNPAGVSRNNIRLNQPMPG